VGLSSQEDVGTRLGDEDEAILADWLAHAASPAESNK